MQRSRSSFSNIRSRNRFIIRLAVSAAVGVLVLLISAVGASAEHTTAEKRAQAEAIMAEIQSIDEEVGAAAERWNGANLELESLTHELADTREDLVRARGLLKISQARAAERLRELYINGEPNSTLEVLLGAQTLDEIITGLEASQRIASQDASIVRQAKTFRKRVTEREEQLSEAREEQAVVVDQLASEKEAIEARLAERQHLLESVQDDIARLAAAERLRQAELRRQAQLELERQRAAEAAAAAASTAAATAASDESSQAPEYAPPPADGSRGAQVVAIAMQYLGIPYVWGGASPSQGFDCSGLTTYVFAQIGVSLPHHAASQYQLGVPVSIDQLAPGDLVFFRGLGHMGMYIGGGNFIHAPHTGDVVKISSLYESYYAANWVGAKRVL